MSLESISIRKDDYWECQRNHNNLTAKEHLSILNGRRYAIGRSSNKESLVKHLQRSGRGMISYIPFSNVELRRLIQARRIPLHLEDSRLGTRDQLLMALRADDDSPSFTRFVELPAELRARIYGFHFADFDEEPLHAPAQPPITRASSLLRREASPLFYQQCTFVIDTYVPTRSRFTIGDSRFWRKTLLWLGGTTEESIADIRRLQFRVHRERNIWDGYQLDAAVSIHGSEVVIDKTFDSKANNEMKGFEKVQELTAKIQAREGMSKLRKDDIYELRSAVEYFYLDSSRR